MAGKAVDTSASINTLTDKISQIERRDQLALVQSARNKVAGGKSITNAEKRAVANFDAEQLAKWGPLYVRDFPKKAFLAGTGLSAKVAIDQSIRFGGVYHTSGNTFDLLAQCCSHHRFFSENKHLLNKVFMSKKIDESLEEGEESLEFWQRELVRERTLRERDNRAEREKNMLPRELIHDFLQEFYVEPMTRRIELLDRREGTMSPGEVSDLLRDDIQNFREGIEYLFAEDRPDGVEDPASASDELDVKDTELSTVIKDAKKAKARDAKDAKKKAASPSKKA